MRISDWSSDVCSSDLRVVLIGDPAPHDLTGIRLSVDFGRVLRHWGVVHGTHTRPRMRHAGPGAPHGAWPLVAANFGTRGCRGPAYLNKCRPTGRTDKQQRGHVSRTGKSTGPLQGYGTPHTT